MVTKTRRKLRERSEAVIVIVNPLLFIVAFMPGINARDMPRMSRMIFREVTRSDESRSRFYVPMVLGQRVTGGITIGLSDDGRGTPCPGQPIPRWPVLSPRNYDTRDITP
ncbi:MAG: hypothetical protein PVSMB8_00360 [Vulcanimicrobiaceae bacterium]